APAAVDDHSPRLARARALVQGPAAAARRSRSCDLWLSRLPAAAVRRHSHVSRPVRAGGRGSGCSRGITREVARRFNHIYGREPQFEQKAERAIKSLGSRNSAMYRTLRKEYQEKGDADALAKARALVESNARLTVADRDRLFGFLEGTGI